MNRDHRKEVIETVGLIAVVASLVFLALEIRQNTDALYSESRQSVLVAAQTELLQLVENPGLVVSATKEEPLTEEEQVALGAWLAAAMRAREYSWLQYRDGSIDDAQWETEVFVIRWMLDSERTRQWWVNIGRRNVSPGFGSFVDADMQSQPGTGDGWLSETNWAQP